MSKKQEQPMKTLANCSPVEFLRQTNKIRHAVSAWLKEAGVAEIRARQPALTGKETKEELKAARRAQAEKNLSDMADVLMDTHAEETVRVLGMMCFLEPGEVDGLTGLELLAPAVDLLRNKSVMDFLLLSAELGLMRTGA